MIDDDLLALLKSAQPPSRGKNILGEGREVVNITSQLAVRTAPLLPQLIQETPLAPIPQPATGGAGNETGGGPAPVTSFQFQVTVAPGGATCTVNPSSFLQQSYKKADLLSIGALGTRTLSGTDVIWLVVDVDSSVFPYTFSGATIQSLGNGDTFDGGEVENDGGMGMPPVYSQTKMRIVIALVNSGVVTQIATSQLRIDQGIPLDSNDASGGSDEIVFAAYAYPC